MCSVVFTNERFWGASKVMRQFACSGYDSGKERGTRNRSWRGLPNRCLCCLIRFWNPWSWSLFLVLDILSAFNQSDLQLLLSMARTRIRVMLFLVIQYVSIRCVQTVCTRYLVLRPMWSAVKQSVWEDGPRPWELRI